MAADIVGQNTFAEGARLALDLLRNAKRLDEEEGIGEGADRLQGRRLMAPILERLAQRPDLIDGFDAVLTDVLQAAAAEGRADWRAYERAASGFRLIVS